VAWAEWTSDPGHLHLPNETEAVAHPAAAFSHGPAPVEAMLDRDVLNTNLH
jgi:hypothetical protein